MDLVTLRNKKAFISDMDGVIYHGSKLMPGAKEYVEWLNAENKAYLFLTNNAGRTQQQTAEKLQRLGLDVGAEHCYTSALATAEFMARQIPNGTAFVIGDDGIREALREVGYTEDDKTPDYVVVSETHKYDYRSVTHAINLVRRGARLIGTNPDISGPVEDGLVPGTGAIMAPIELASESTAYYVGKPNPLIMRNALKHLRCRREETAIIGDRMDTDIIAGIESEIETVLVLTGVTSRQMLPRIAYKPGYVLEYVGQIVPGFQA
jgi:NagD protein